MAKKTFSSVSVMKAVKNKHTELWEQLMHIDKAETDFEFVWKQNFNFNSIYLFLGDFQLHLMVFMSE